MGLHEARREAIPKMGGNALQAAAKDVLGDTDDAKKHEDGLCIAVLKPQQHRCGAVLSRLREPRHHSTSSVCVVRNEIVDARSAAA